MSADLTALAEGRAGSGLRIVNDRVLIDAVAAHDINVLKADLEALGMRDAVAFGRMVSGQLPINAIGALNGLASLQFARPAYAATHPGGPREGVR